MTSSWRPFVPEPVLDLLARQPDAVQVAVPVRRRAVVLFADVAGFTGLSEELCARGRHGAEELNRLLNGYFSHLIDRISAYGGTVLRFAGDAVTALFPQDGVRRAVQCALEMQEATVGFRDLAMKVGLAVGPLTSAVLGDREIRLDYFVTGQAMDDAARAESRARPGEVVVADGFACDGMVVGERRDGAQVVTGLVPAAEAAPVSPRSVADDVIAGLAPFLHAPVAARLLAGRRDLVNENRKVSVAFVAFPQGDTAQNQEFVADAVRTIERHGGHLLQIDSGDKGNLLVICFGAPVAHEDDEHRAVRCCLELVRRDGVRAGLTTAFAFCGEVGSDRRREYLVVGDSVNLAARLMQAAGQGQLLVDRRTHDRVSPAVRTRTLAPMRVKGKAARVRVWEVHDLTDATPVPLTPHELVGRGEETARLRDAVERAAAGRGQCVVLRGEAGIGKSRLAAEAARIAAAAGLGVYWGAAQARDTQTAYLAWRPVWRRMIGADRARLDAYVSELDGGSAQRAPLLAPVVNVAMPDTGLTRGLDAATRAEFLRVLLVDALRHRAAGGPVAVLVEDGQWLDPASAALLEFLAGDIADQPVLLLVTSRDPLGVGATEVVLSELPDVDAETLVLQRLRRLYGEDVAVPADLLASLVDRCDGNPLYLEEIASLLHDRGVDPRDAAAARIELPETLHSLLTARLDQLGEAEQAAVKVASVIGRRFRASWLRGAYPALGDVRVPLDRLEQLELTSVRAGGTEPEYVFRHALIQEAAYDTLTFALRETLHESVAAFIERTYDDPAELADALVYHYGRSRNVAKQVTWFRAAGDAAHATFANETAISHYERLLPLLPAGQRGDVLVRLGSLWHLTGQWTEAEQACREAMESGTGLVRAQSLRDIGVLATYRRAYADAVAFLADAGAEFERLGDVAGVASTLDRLSFAYFQQGRYPEALDHAERHLAIATEIGDMSGQSAALENMGLVHGHTSNYSLAVDLLERALSTAEQAGNRRAVAYAANDLAGVHLRHGDHVRAMACVQRAWEAAEEIGFRSLVAVLVGNAGELYREHGDHARALGCFAHVLQIAFDLRDWTTVISEIGNVGLTAAALGRRDVARRLLERSVEFARVLQAPYLVCEFLYWLALLHAESGEPERAAPLNAEALAIADQIDHRHHRLHCRLLEIRLTGAADRLEALAREWADPADQAAVHAELWRHNGNEHSMRRALELSQELYAQAPTEECRQRLAWLGGALPATPALPAFAPGHSDLDAVLDRIDLDLVGRLIAS